MNHDCGFLKHRLWWYWWAMMAIVYFVCFTPVLVMRHFMRLSNDAVFAGLNEIGRVMHHHRALGWPKNA